MERNKNGQGTEAIEMLEDEFMKSLEALEEIAKSGAVDNKADDDNDEDDNDVTDNDDGRTDDDEDDDDTDKSFADFDEDSEVRKAIEVSDFLSELVDRVGQKIDDFDARLTTMEKSLTKTAGMQKSLVEAVKDSFQDMIKSQRNGINDLRKSLDGFGEAPARGRKSVKVMEKSFEGLESNDTNQLTKSQVLDKLTDLVIAKDPRVNSQDVIRFESTNELRPDLRKLIYGQ